MKIPEKLIQIKARQILRERQQKGTISTLESARKEAIKDIESYNYLRRGLLGYKANLWASETFFTFRKWTGIQNKKGLDLLPLVVSISIPLIIFFGTKSFNEQQQELAHQRYQQETLMKYLEQMSQLLLDKNLRQEEGEVRKIARARTISTLRELDSERRGLLIRFLAEAELISAIKPIVSLRDAALKGVNLSEANISGVNISGAILSGADFTGAILTKINLKEAILAGSHLGRANPNLDGANLEESDLEKANLDGANLDGANLKKANLYATNLNGANLNKANLIGAKDFTTEQIKKACNWDKAQYEQGKLEELRRDTTSDSSKPPDCSKWKN